jgi:tRNA dimethylallyltransferase
MTIKNAVFIVGPTGVGKTAVAIEVAESLNTEIISADSRQIYSELNIGTAVPDPAQMKRVRHHLLRHRSVIDYYNAGLYEQEALQVMENLFHEHAALVIAGGSGLYIQAICQGIDDIPAVDPEIRKALIDRIEGEGIESLRFELKKLDPTSYESIDLKNPKRILKALEISMTTGKPYSDFLTSEKKSRDFNILKIGLNMDRELLYERINQRVEEMMANGLLEEVESCLEFRDLNALNTVGYKELFDYLDGKHSLEEAILLIKRNTRHYARRQLTWFRKDPDVNWFSPLQLPEIIRFVKDATG